MPRGRRFLGALAVPFVLVVACSSYTATKAPNADEEDDSGTASNTPTPGSTTPGNGTPPPGTDADIADVNTADVTQYGTPCPTCPSDKTCMAVGCDGAPLQNHCATATEVTATASFTVFVCPAGDKAKLLATCQTGADRPAAAFHLGTGSWNFVVHDSSDFYLGTRTSVGDACQSPTQCGGGNGPAQLPAPGGATIAVAPAPPGSGCATITVDFTKT